MIRPEVGAFCPFSRRDLREVRFNFVFLVPPLVLPLPAALVEAEGFFLPCVDFRPHPACAHNPAPASSNAVIRTVFSRKLSPRLQSYRVSAGTTPGRKMVSTRSPSARRNTLNTTLSPALSFPRILRYSSTEFTC